MKYYLLFSLLVLQLSGCKLQSQSFENQLELDLDSFYNNNLTFPGLYEEFLKSDIKKTLPSIMEGMDFREDSLNYFLYSINEQGFDVRVKAWDSHMDQLNFVLLKEKGYYGKIEEIQEIEKDDRMLHMNNQFMADIQEWDSTFINRASYQTNSTHPTYNTAIRIIKQKGDYVIDINTFVSYVVNSVLKYTKENEKEWLESLEDYNGEY